MIRISMTSLGCAKNLVNTEQMLALLQEAGYDITAEPDEADVAIVNTCGFIDSAKMEAIENILYLGALKGDGLKKLIVTGCLSQRYGEELIREMPEIDAVVGVGSFGEIVGIVEDLLENDEPLLAMGDINAPVEELGRVVTTGPGWAYLRIAEGCDNRCSYCVIPSLRGSFRSREMESILAEAEDLAQGGVKELIVIAQDITRYGTDLYGKRCLAQLVEKLAQIEGVEWIRLHYLYPDEIDEELIRVMAAEPKVLRYLDIPIQHINTEILKKMNRRGTGEEIRALFTRLKEALPGLVLRTSLITGLPGEDEEAFEELCLFLREMKIQRAGVFPFSPEEGTPAAEMERVDTEVAQRRAELVMEIQNAVMDEFDLSRVDTVTTVLCEGFDEECCLWYGRSFAESPDVDGRILFTGEGIEPGEFCDIIIRGELEGELVGEKID